VRGLRAAAGRGSVSSPSSKNDTDYGSCAGTSLTVGTSMTVRLSACNRCNFSLTPLNPPLSCREAAYGWRTRHSVDSMHTLVQDLIPRGGAATEAEPESAPEAEIQRAVRATAAAETHAPTVPRSQNLTLPFSSAPRRSIVPRSPTTSRPLREGMLVHGRYRLCERLGAGGFGVVWRACDERLHREVALKRIPLATPLPELTDAHVQHGPTDVPVHATSTSASASLAAPAHDQEERLEPYCDAERASREALATARLAHPAIVALYEAYVEDDAFYLVSELVHGDTLAAVLAAGELTDEELLQIGVALAQALEHAHARGVIHRDVKPHNVLVPHGRGLSHERGPHEATAKLTDFGGASLVGEDGLTRPGETLGTLAYMAPEQSEGYEADAAADVYSLALVLYEGLTGSNPVRGPTPAVTARRIGRPLPPVADLRPDLPVAATSALDTALTIDPDRRGTMLELHDGLAHALNEGFAPRDSDRRLAGADSLGDTSTAGNTQRARRPPFLPALPPFQQPHFAASGREPGALGTDMDIPRRPRPSMDYHSPPNASVASPYPPPVAERPRRSLPLSLPRAVWLGCALAAAIWLIMSARPGTALLLLAAAAPLLALGPRPGTAWLAAGLAPLLGVVGLAGAYPALAGQPARWPTRATLGALGYWWLMLAGPLLTGSRGGTGDGTRLWLWPSAELPPRAVWEGSLDSAANHVIWPVLTTGVLFGALLWAVAAITLPWVVRGRGALRDTLAAVAWSVVLLAATPYFDTGLSALMPGSGLVHPRGVVLGAVLGGGVAVAARALRGPVAAAHP
jgi:eukaryotic-like serine/threonine-protein kinase